MLIGDRACTYDQDHFLINTLDIPASTQTLDASLAKPCLGLVLKFDFRVIAELATQSAPPPPARSADDSSMILGAVTPALLEPFGRLLAMLDEPSAMPVLAPLVVRVIHYRLLMSEQGARLWRIASVGSLSQRIARAIDWLRTNYAQPLRVEDLAAYAQMGQSTFHRHFRQLTAMSPLQYQKWLRFHEARHLMLNGRFDAAQAAYRQSKNRLHLPAQLAR